MRKTSHGAPRRLATQKPRRENLALVDDEHVTGFEEVDEVDEGEVPKVALRRHDEEAARVPALRRIPGDAVGGELVVVVGDARAVDARHAYSSTKSDPWAPSFPSGIVYPKRRKARGVATRP